MPPKRPCPPCGPGGRPTPATLNRLLIENLADPARVARLLANGADPATRAPNGYPVLEVAIARNLHESAQLLRDTLELQRKWQKAPR